MYVTPLTAIQWSWWHVTKKGTLMAKLNLKDSLGSIMEKASVKAEEIGETVSETAKEGLKIANQKAQDARQEIRKRYYNPLFPDQYFDEDFDRPKIVVIEDEDARKAIDVCEGAIGWLSKEAGFEVLHLYEEFVPRCELTFYPRSSCAAIYYRNPNQEHRYINLSCYFETMQNDKMTELRNIAFCLGAKRCRLESYEEEKQMRVGKGKLKIAAKAGKTKAEAKSIDADGSVALHTESDRVRHVVFEHSFEGSDAPVMPTLDWYENDKEILSLIDMRLKGRDINLMKEYAVSIDSKLSQSMDANLASRLDAALKKLKVVSNFTLEGESLKEARTKLKFVVQF